MAYTAGNLYLIAGAGPGRNVYVYHTTDLPDVVEDAGYFDNVDDNLNFAKGDIIESVTWATAVDTGTISAFKRFIVTNVIGRDAAANAGDVNIAEINGTGTVSSQG